MVKKILGIIGFTALFCLIMAPSAYMADEVGSPTSSTEPTGLQDADFGSRCARAKDMGFPPCASNPSECESQPTGTLKLTEGGEEKEFAVHRVPFNCIFIAEPIGGKTGYDLYKKTPQYDKAGNVIYELWYGEVLVGEEVGPLQALVTFEEGKETEGPFTLLYNYLGLVYDFLSGIIIGFVVLVTVIGGVRMTISSGDQGKYDEGKKMIIKALVGMILWFTASVILYTINPTFFAF